MIKRVNRNALADDLLTVAKKITHRADEQLDQHGRAIKPTEADSEFGPNTVVVDRTDEPAGELFVKSA